MSRCDQHRGKRPFRSRHRAEAAIAAMGSVHARDRRDRRPVRSYLCPGCDRWFLTSQPGADHDDDED